MTSTSVKHRDFIGEPMGEKEVTSIAGIGPTYGAKLTEAGFDKAYVLFGQFLLGGGSELAFADFLKSEFSFSAVHAKTAAACLGDWASLASCPSLSTLLGAATARSLSTRGIDKAHFLFGQFLLLKKDEELFIRWLRSDGGLSRKEAMAATKKVVDFGEGRPLLLTPPATPPSSSSSTPASSAASSPSSSR